MRLDAGLRGTLIIVCVLLGSGARGELAPPARISAEEFGAVPFLAGPKLSPSGTKVLSSAVRQGRRRVVVLDLADHSKVIQAFEVPENGDLVSYRWAGEQRILISVGITAHFQGEEVFATRLLVYDFATKQLQVVGKRQEGFDGDDVIFVAEDGAFLLLSAQRTLYDYPAVWKVDLNTLKMAQVVKPQQHVWDWFADTSGVVRAGLGVADSGWWLLYRKSEDARFERVLRRKGDETQNEIERFVLLDDADQGFAVANTRTGRYGLYRYDFASDMLGEPLFEHPEVDIEDVSLTPSGAVEAIYYVDDRPRVQWLVPEMNKVQSDIDAALPNRINRIVSATRDGKRMLVWTGSASDPGAYYFYETAAETMSLLARPYEKIRVGTLAPMQSTSYLARDGLKIPAYLTLPVGRAPKALPLIVMPHGGPFVRDQWAYDPWVQFLANRGYVVLQPNFRGSTGYGRAFVEKGQGQWGRGMQDDLDDGVKWLIEQGTVDPKRVCIMGASYGGYAAMWAAARNPEIYRCAISFAGVSDLAAMIRYDRRLFSATRYYRSWKAKVQGEDTFDLDSVSPLYAADRIAIPLLLAHGSADKTVPVSQSEKLHHALTKQKKNHVFVKYEGEGHGFASAENSIDFLQRVEAFLRTHNPSE